MSETLNIILLVVCGGVALFIIKQLLFNKQSKHIVIKDSKAQSVYDKSKHSNDEELSMALQDRIELSWEFLTRIADQVIQRFSKSDKEVVYKSGEVFNKHGMQYQHNVDHEVKISKQAMISKAKVKSKKQSISR